MNKKRDMTDVFECSRDFLKSIYGEKYCRRVCSEVEMTSILTLLWISLEAAGISHDFKEKEELYQYLRETFKIKAPDQMHSDDNKSESTDELPMFEDIATNLTPDSQLKNKVKKLLEEEEAEAEIKTADLEATIEKELKQELNEITINSQLPTEDPQTEIASETTEKEASEKEISAKVAEIVEETLLELRDFPTTEIQTEIEVQTELQTEANSEFVEIECIVEPFKSKRYDSSGDEGKKKKKLRKKQKTEIQSDNLISTNSNNSSSSEGESLGTEEDLEEKCLEVEEPIHPRIAELLAIPQPEQKSLAWLSQRQDYITASVFGASTGLLGPAALTNLLLDKVSRGKLNPFGGSQATHWGEKYEPISNDLYCYRMKAKTYEFGMIAHPDSDLNFLGASTDGIAVYKGKLTNIEIKSPFSRHITGIPKPEYWAQMQLQMEILNLDETHFIESKFREYDMDEFWKLFDLTLSQIDNEDVSISEDPEDELEANREYDAEGDPLSMFSEVDTLQLAKMRHKAKNRANGLQGDQVTPLRILKKEERGIMIEAIALDKEENDGTPKRIYISSPIKYYKSEKGLRKWYDAQLKEISQSNNMIFLKSNGWIVERFSCVYVERDRIWFKNQIPTVKNFWQDVLQYRNENLSLDQVGKLKEPLLNKYRSIIATNTAMNIQKPKSSKTLSTTKLKVTRSYRKANVDEEVEDSDELPIGILGGCMLDSGSTNGTNSSLPSMVSNPSLTNKIKIGSNSGSNNNSRVNSGVTSGFGGIGGRFGGGCLLADESPSSTPKSTPQSTPINTPMAPKKKVVGVGLKKFF